MSDLKEQLLPCPFCKNTVLRVFNRPDEHGRDSFGVQCGASDCAICGPEQGTASEAIAAWNRRAPAAAPAPVAASAGLLDEIACLNRRIAVMQNELNMRHAKDTGEVWYWQGDGTDDPASMCNVLTVVINAADLRAALAAVPAAAPIVQPAGDQRAAERVRAVLAAQGIHMGSAFIGELLAAAAPSVQAEPVAWACPLDLDLTPLVVPDVAWGAECNWQDRYQPFPLYAAPTSSTADAKDAEAWAEGVLMSVSVLNSLFDQPGMASCVLRELGLAEADCSALDDFDKENLRIIQAQGRDMKLRGLGAAIATSADEVKS